MQNKASLFLKRLTNYRRFSTTFHWRIWRGDSRTISVISLLSFGFGKRITPDIRISNELLYFTHHRFRAGRVNERRHNQAVSVIGKFIGNSPIVCKCIWSRNQVISCKWQNGISRFIIVLTKSAFMPRANLPLLTLLSTWLGVTPACLQMHSSKNLMAAAVFLGSTLSDALIRSALKLPARSRDNPANLIVKSYHGHSQ